MAIARTNILTGVTVEKPARTLTASPVSLPMSRSVSEKVAQPVAATTTRQPVTTQPANILPNSGEPVIKVSSNQENTEPVTTFGKTIAGKILKGTLIAGGSILGLGGIIGGIGGAVAGTGVAAGAVTGVKKVASTVGKSVSKVSQAAVNLVTGTTKAERDQVRVVKGEAKEAKEQLEQVERLIKAGATPEAARSMAGIPEAELTEYDGKPIMAAGFDTKTLLIIGGVLAAFVLLPKLLKR